MGRRAGIALGTLALGTLVLGLTVAAGPPATAMTQSPGVTPPSAAGSAVRPAARLAAGRDAWVAVSVARLWQSPSSPRPVDAPALAAPVRFTTWLRAMSLSQRRNLDLHSDTEALLGDRVLVVRLRRHWAKVVVPSQPSQKDARGYPGWVPRRQLTAAAPRTSTDVASVVTRTSWLRADDERATRTTRISFGTSLPVVGQVPGFVRVSTPTGTVRRLPARTVSVHPTGTPALAPSRASLVGTAKKFLGLPYLWGGLSGFGLDCSGLTWLDYRAHGIAIPRDALPQSRNGVVPAARRPGDLLFYAHAGRVHHVTMDIGRGRVLHAPRTGASVRIDAFDEQPLRREYAGARRYLP